MIELLFGAPDGAKKRAKEAVDEIKEERKQIKQDAVDEIKEKLRKAARSDNKDAFADAVTSILSQFFLDDDEEDDE